MHLPVPILNLPPVLAPLHQSPPPSVLVPPTSPTSVSVSGASAGGDVVTIIMADSQNLVDSSGYLILRSVGGRGEAGPGPGPGRLVRC